MDFYRIDGQSDFYESIAWSGTAVFDGTINSLGGGQLKLIEEFLVVHSLVHEESDETRDGL